MKCRKMAVFVLILTLLLTACAAPQIQPEAKDSVLIELSDSGIKVDGGEETDAVYTAHDIVYYEEGKDFTYGEGAEKDAHSKEEADAHTVVHITKAGQ